MSQLHKLQELNVEGKKVLMRVDFNVPLDGQRKITDDTRIRSSLPSIQWILERGGAVILMSHLGRPKGAPKPELSLSPVAHHLSHLLNQPVPLAPDCTSETTQHLAENLKPGEVLLLENLRFNEAETKPEQDPEFAKTLASLADLYVNDAFGTAHRIHSSTYTVAELFSHPAAGLLMQKEVEALYGLIHEPERPLYAIIGGAKVSSKLGVMKSLAQQVDGLLIGGGMAFTFWKALGHSIGSSLCEEEMLEEAKGVLELCKERGIPCLLPTDAICAQEIGDEVATAVHTANEGVPEGWMGLDIGPATQKVFVEAVGHAKTVLWNGPMGVFEHAPFAEGTLSLAHALATHDGKTVAGGGDSIAAIQQSGVADRFTHLSTGGGASLEYIEKGELPGIEILRSKVGERG